MNNPLGLAQAKQSATPASSLVMLGSQLCLNQKTNKIIDEVRISDALKRAAKPRCPNTVGIHLFSLSTGKCYPLSCKRWSCSHCGYWKREAAKLLLDEGCMRAWRQQERVRFLTLTDASAGGMTLAEMSHAWNGLRAALAHKGEIRQFAAVVELTRQGAWHLHVLARGSYIDQHRLSERAAARGFGAVCDIRLVRKQTNLDAYATKMSRYLAKAAQQREAERIQRFRPLRTSRGWFPGGFREAERQVVKRTTGKASTPDAGPFVLAGFSPITGDVWTKEIGNV